MNKFEELANILEKEISGGNPSQFVPRQREECMSELAQWFVKHRREMTIKDMRPIIEKHFGKETDAYTEFCEYLGSPEGGQEFKKRLRLEAWKAGLAGPPS